MMTRVMITIATLLVVGLAGAAMLYAQTSTSTSSLGLPSTAVVAGCPAPVAGVTNYCWGADKFEVSPNGAAYQVIWPAAATATGVQKVQGISPGTTGNVSLTCTVAIPSVPIGFALATGGSLSAAFPQETYTAACVGAGS